MSSKGFAQGVSHFAKVVKASVRLLGEKRCDYHMIGAAGKLRLLKGPLYGTRAHTASLPCWYPSAGIDFRCAYRPQISVPIRHSPDLIYLPTHKAIQCIWRPCSEVYYSPNMADEERVLPLSCLLFADHTDRIACTSAILDTCTIFWPG